MKKKGFTLLELMIVVIIIGILAALAMPRFIDAVNDAKEAEADSMLGALRSSQLRYAAEHEVYALNATALDLDLTAGKYYTPDLTGATGTPGTGANVVAKVTTSTTGLDSDLTITEDGTISPH